MERLLRSFLIRGLLLGLALGYLAALLAFRPFDCPAWSAVGATIGFVCGILLDTEAVRRFLVQAVGTFLIQCTHSAAANVAAQVRRIPDARTMWMAVRGDLKLPQFQLKRFFASTALFAASFFMFRTAVSLGGEYTAFMCSGALFGGAVGALIRGGWIWGMLVGLAVPYVIAGLMMLIYGR